MWNILNIWVACEQMMEDVHVKLNPGLPWQKMHLARRRLFLPAIGLKFEEETIKMLHLEHGFVWC